MYIAKCTEFITSYTDASIKEDPIHGKHKYLIQIQRIANKEDQVINIELSDVQEHFNTARDSHFVDRIRVNTQRYVSLFSQVVDANMLQPTVNFREDQMSTYEILMHQRKFNFQQALAAQATSLSGQVHDAKFQLPPELERQYQLFIVNGENAKKTILKMREVKSNQIGGLVTIKGIVTRCSDVKPCIQVAVYACDVCGFEVYQIINSREFNPKVECPSRRCMQNQTKGQLVMQVKSSRFVSFQEIKIQEPSD